MRTFPISIGHSRNKVDGRSRLIMDLNLYSNFSFPFPNYRHLGFRYHTRLQTVAETLPSPAQYAHLGGVPEALA